MPAEAKTYRKQNSFEAFSSSINASLEEQSKRIVGVLPSFIESEKDKHKKNVLKTALRDLSAKDPSSSGFKVNRYIADEVSRLEDNQIAKYIFHRYRYDIYPKQKIIDGWPPYIQIEPTSICNFRCVFCYQSDPEFTKTSNGHMGSMGLDMFKSVIDQIQGNVEFLSLSSRGEPLVCNDIDAMLEYCRNKFLGLKLNINASLLDEKRSHAILSGGVNTVVFSADTADEALYSKLRIKGKLNDVLKNIEQFVSIRKKQYSDSKIITRVSGVKFNDKQNMESMKKLWGSLVDQVTFVSYNPWENVYDADVNFILEPCSDLWRRMFIWFDGKINPCDTDYKSTLSVGSVKEKSIPEIWQSENYKKLRETHLSKKRSTINPCKRCVVI